MILDLRQAYSFCPCPAGLPPSSSSALQFYLKSMIILQESEAVPELCPPVPVPRQQPSCSALSAHFFHCHCLGLTSVTGSGLCRLSGSMICLPAVLISNDRKLNLLRLKNVIRMSQDWKFCAILPGFNSNFKVLAHSPNSALAAPLWGCCNRSCSIQGAAGTVLQQFRMCPVALVPRCCCNINFFQLSRFHTGPFGDFGSAEGTSSGLMGEWGQCLLGVAGESQFPCRDWTLGNL